LGPRGETGARGKDNEKEPERGEPTQKESKLSVGWEMARDQG